MIYYLQYVKIFIEHIDNIELQIYYVK
jgi:hypothetical protein